MPHTPKDISLAFNPPAYLPTSANAPPPVDVSAIPPHAVLAIAEGSSSPSTVLDKLGFTPEQIDWVMQHPPFLLQIERYREDLQKNGYTFRAKAVWLAEEHLATANDMIMDPQMPPPVRADLIKWVAKMAALEPKPDGKGGPLGAGVSIVINLDKTPTIINQS